MTVFAIAAGSLVVMLTGSAAVLAGVSDRRLGDLSGQGPHMKRIGGILLIAIGLWFLFLAVANPTYLLP